MLYFLADRGNPPAMFGRPHEKQVPVVGITASALIMLIGVAMNYMAPG